VPASNLCQTHEFMAKVSATPYLTD